MAIDFQTDSDGLALMKDISMYVDIIELGTCFLYTYGMKVIADYKKVYPAKSILADCKIMDAGYEQAKKFFQAGADIVTVMALSDINTIKQAVLAAKEMGGEIMLDTMNIEDFSKLKNKLYGIDIHIFCIHIPIDLDKPDVIKNNILQFKESGFNGKLACAGGVTPALAKELASLGVDIAVVGRSITDAKDPIDAASRFHNL